MIVGQGGAGVPGGGVPESPLNLIECCDFQLALTCFPRLPVIHVLTFDRLKNPVSCIGTPTSLDSGLLPATVTYCNPTMFMVLPGIV